MWHFVVLCIVYPFFHAFVYFSPNIYQLPFNCYIFFLPPDGFSFSWEFNYLAIIAATIPVALIFAVYPLMPLLLMNHSCWLIDMALVTAETMNRDLKYGDETERAEKCNENLKKFIARCQKFVIWQTTMQDLLQWNFNLELQVQSMILCFSIYALSFSFSGLLFVLTMSSVSLSQLFSLCWMGSRVTSRIDQLSRDIGKHWYLMQPSQRKNLQLVIHWTQNMLGFHGIFKDVSLTTFQSVKFTLL